MFFAIFALSTIDLVGDPTDIAGGGGAQGARAPPLLSVSVAEFIYQLLYTANKSVYT